MAAADSVPEVDSAALLSALQALRRGNFSARLPVDWPGLGGRIADTFNEIVTLTQHLGSELARLNRAVGKQGRIVSGPLWAASQAAGWSAGRR